MKIFSAKTLNTQDGHKDIVTTLLDNKLSISEKIDNLINSYSELRLSNGAMEELITRLLKKNGGSIRFPRKGDNNERFDAVISFPTYSCATEIEIPSTEILDAPRNLLDDYAVLNQRRQGSAKETVVPVVICWDLPNRRTDYWNVISDVEKVVGIKIKTISIIALSISYWLDEEVHLDNDDFFLKYGKEEMDFVMGILSKNNITSTSLQGYLEPLK